ncbi:phage protein NinX family protein [Pseudomonas fluorescens]|uniref:phage protein NinX family protein n=1 Tax=Pseudomonas fluorescens TaxID=294 RepID=UPI003D25F28F
MIKVKVSELSGAGLDYAVDLAVHGGKPSDAHAYAWRYQNNERKDYSTNWSHCGPLIDKYDPDQRRLPHGQKYAEVWIDRADGSAIHGNGAGATRLIAFCRALVTVKRGHEIEIPEELLKMA